MSLKGLFNGYVQCHLKSNEPYIYILFTNFISTQVREASDLYAIDEDKDRLFLLSLLPFMKQLNSRENLEFRTEIQQLLQKKQHPNGQCN